MPMGNLEEPTYTWFLEVANGWPTGVVMALQI